MCTTFSHQVLKKSKKPKITQNLFLNQKKNEAVYYKAVKKKVKTRFNW